MQFPNGTVVTPAPGVVIPVGGATRCASQQAIGNGLYLQHTGTPRVLTILAAFQDAGFTVNHPLEAFDQYLNGDRQQDLGNKNNLNTASVRQYFATCSQGQFAPQFDVVGPVVLPQKMSYYGGSNSTGTDERFSAFCQDAMTQAKPLVADWSQYDNDGDGRIELVCVVFAGFGQNQGGADSTIWAKASQQGIKVSDQLTITRFNCTSELFHPQYPEYINGTGVFIHEFSHCMGLPDLYATTSRAQIDNQGMETWSIMDYGLYNNNSFAPCAYTAWEQQVMGWTEIEEVKTDELQSEKFITDMMPLIEGGKAYKLVNGSNSRDFIVMENVQQRGLNSRAYGHGLLVYHVDYPYTSVNMTDSPNNTPGHPSVAVVPASGLFINNYLATGDHATHTRAEWKESMASAPFPGTKQVTSLTDQAQLPNYCFYNGSTRRTTGFQLSSIAEQAESGAVSFTVAADDLSDIKDVRLAEHDGNPAVYDLYGRRLSPLTSYHSPLKKGLYIVNGRKVIVTGADQRK